MSKEKQKMRNASSLDDSCGTQDPHASFLPRQQRLPAVKPYQKVYTLSEFINAFDFPQSAKVVEGNYGPSEASTISQGATLLLCRLKANKMVMAKDANNVMHSIPYDSSLMYAPLDTVYGLKGHVYNSVNELLSCPELPKVVHIDAKTATNLCLNDSDQLIFPCYKDQDLLGRSLICCDQRNTRFKLSGARHGSFSTKPNDIKMGIQSCVKHITEFPYVVARYSVDGSMFPDTGSSILKLTGTSNKQSVIAKVMSEGTSDDSSMIEVPLDVPIKLQCLQTNSQGNEDDASETNHSVDKLQNHLCASDTQVEKYMTPLNVSALDEEQPVYEHLVDPVSKGSVHLTNKNAHDYQSLIPKQNAGLPGKFLIHPAQKRFGTNQTNIQPPQFHTSTVENDGGDTYLSISPPNEYLSILPPDLYDDIVNLPENLREAFYDQFQQIKRMQQLEETNKRLLTEVAQLQACVNELVRLVVNKNPENNIKQLSSLEINEVSVILHTMGLSEYEHIFRENKINGKKLVNLDRKKLSQYGITDTNDQDGLWDLIKGKVSPLCYLLRLPSNNSGETYLQFTKTFRKINQYY